MRLPGESSVFRARVAAESGVRGVQCWLYGERCEKGRGALGRQSGGGRPAGGRWEPSHQTSAVLYMYSMIAEAFRLSFSSTAKFRLEMDLSSPFILESERSYLVFFKLT